MKRLSISSILLIAMMAADVNWVRIIGSSDSPLQPERYVIKSDDSGVLIRTTVFGFTKDDTTVDNKNFKRIKIPGEPIDQNTTKAGKAQIPYLKLLIAVPDSAEFEITINESEYTRFDNYLLYPIPGIVIEDTNGYFYAKEVYTYDTSFYETDTLYPGKFYEVINDGHWRDQRVLEVFLYPIQFSPNQELMYCYYGFDLRIEYSGTVAENINGLGPFEKIGREVLLNYPGIDREPGPHPPPSVHYYADLLNQNNIADYIIVTHDDFLVNETASYWIHKFAQHRVDHNGFDVGVVSMTDVYDEFLTQLPPDSAKALRDFLVYAYENWDAGNSADNHFAHCLFIGDWDYVPSKLTQSNDWVVAEEHYFQDLYSSSCQQFMLGRWPAKERHGGVYDLLTIVQKTLNYEQNPDVVTNDWRRKGLISTGHGDFEPHVTKSIPFFSAIEYDTFVVRWSNGHFADSMDKYLNHGEIIATYFDHGAPEGWYEYDTTQVKNLTNDRRLPVVLSMACWTANFQWDHPGNHHPGYPPSTCFAEHFLFNPDGGCVAYRGATIETVENDWVEEALKRVLQYQYWILGEMLINLAADDRSHYCLLGDPALDLGDCTAYPDLPDVCVRPQGIDISLKEPYPYPAGGDVIPIQAKVYNIGGAVANNVPVKFEVGCEEILIYTNTVLINEIQPQDTAVALVYWDTGITHPNYYGEIGNCNIIVTADPLDLIEESWGGNNQSSILRKVTLYPYQTGWPKKVTGFSQPEIGNLDGIGSVEIVYPSLDSVYVFNYTGGIFPGWPKYFPEVYTTVLGDIDCMGALEIVAVSPKWITVYDYQGNIMPGWPQQIPAQYQDKRFYGFPALGYIIPGADQYQIVVYIGKDGVGVSPQEARVLVYNYNGGNPIYDFPTSHPSFPYFCNGVCISDVNADGKQEIIVSYKQGGTEQEQEHNWTDIFNKDGLVTTLTWGSLWAPSALADLDLPIDGIPEVITGDDHSSGRLTAYKVTASVPKWTAWLGWMVNASPVVGDIARGSGNEGLEVVTACDNGNIHLRHGEEGNSLAGWPFSAGGGFRCSPALAKLEGPFDQAADIVISSRDQYVYALDYETNAISPFPLFVFGMPSSPVIGDIDGDGKSEIILASRDGYLHTWKQHSSSVPQYTLEWPCFHHDYQRTGLYGWFGQ